MTASAMTPAEKLPVPVLDYPHWRVNYRPAVYVPDRLRTLGECLEVVQKNRVSLRGWDFPHLSRRGAEQTYGDSWIAGSSNFGHHVEYWRLYQSTQFLYLGALPEVASTEWDSKLRRQMTFHADDDADIGSVPGFLSLTNTVHSVTEFFEFAARLAQAQIYVDPVTIDITLDGIRGYMLAADENKIWSSDYVARQPNLRRSVSLAPADLIADAAEAALEWAVWLFERFGWLKPTIALLRTEQKKLLSQRF